MSWSCRHVASAGRVSRCAFLLSLVLLTGWSCGSEQAPAADHCPGSDGTLELPAGPRLIFQTGFEPNTKIIPKDASYDRIEGRDLSVSSRGDWQADLKGSANIADVRLYYAAGNQSQRKASLVPDPDNASNQVLSFRLERANELHTIGVSKGRIQLGLSGLTGMTSWQMEARLRLGSGVEALRQYDRKIDWFTLAEFWNNEANKAYPFRITLNLNKDAPITGGTGDLPLFWGLHGQTKQGKGDWKDQWRIEARNVPVPFNAWVTLRISMVEGCGPTGRILVTLTTDDGTRHVIADRTDWMHHPRDPKLDGFNALNPLKLYTSKALVDFAREAGAPLEVWWDDFKLVQGTKL